MPQNGAAQAVKQYCQHDSRDGGVQAIASAQECNRSRTRGYAHQQTKEDVAPGPAGRIFWRGYPQCQEATDVGRSTCVASSIRFTDLR
jgi:hypothetical protein